MFECCNLSHCLLTVNFTCFVKIWRDVFSRTSMMKLFVKLNISAGELHRRWSSGLQVHSRKFFHFTFFFQFFYFSFLINISLMEKIITNWQLNSTSFTNYNFVISQYNFSIWSRINIAIQVIRHVWCIFGTSRR